MLQCAYISPTRTHTRLMIEATLSLATTVKEEISSVDHTETTFRARPLVTARTHSGKSIHRWRDLGR
jgi:hypothetical protein